MLLFLDLAGAILAFWIDPLAGFAAVLFSSLSLIITVVFTRWRYGKLRQLSDYLRRIADGDYDLDLRDNQEGELSILKSEIYKVTVTLREQAQREATDKLFLADAISDISHQLKTPLTSLSVMTELLGDDELPNERRREFTQSIRSQLTRLQWLVEALLKLSRIDAGVIEFKKEPVRVEELIAKAVEHLIIPMELRDQTLEIGGDPAVEFTGDFNWTREALTNLIKNSLEHTSAGGRISLSYQATPIYTEICVADNGEGIAPADLPYIFNRFYKGKNARPDSVGIGLAMAKSIVEKQGGTIDLHSVPGQGTRFTLKFYKGAV